ncbi:MAG: YfcE family phosphodiesterase [Clostridiales bacterium]|nr:YfcE family phosphodiesterase [Clostridiales bacterium]
MSALVISDSHGKVDRIIEAIDRNLDAIDRVFFLGDGIEDIKLAQVTYYNIQFDYVLGNNDFDDAVPEEKEVFYEGKKILLIHGHTYEGIYGTKRLIEKCKRNGIDAVFMGHTHRKKEVYVEDILFLNPGSIGRPFDGRASYSVIDIDGVIHNNVMYI